METAIKNNTMMVIIPNRIAGLFDNVRAGVDVCVDADDGTVTFFMMPLNKDMPIFVANFPAVAAI